MSVLLITPPEPVPPPPGWASIDAIEAELQLELFNPRSPFIILLLQNVEKLEPGEHPLASTFLRGWNLRKNIVEVSPYGTCTLTQIPQRWEQRGELHVPVDEEGIVIRMPEDRICTLIPLQQGQELLVQQIVICLLNMEEEMVYHSRN